MSILRRKKLILRCLTAFAIFMVLLTMGVGGFIYAYPDTARGILLRAVNNSLPCKDFSFRGAKPVLWPLPGVVFENPKLRMQNGDSISADSAECRFDPPSLLSAVLKPRTITVDRPQLALHVPKTTKEISAGGPNADLALNQSLSAALHYLSGTELVVYNGDVTIYNVLPENNARNTDSEKPIIHAQGIHCTLRFPGILSSGKADGLIKSIRADAQYISPFIPSHLRGAAFRADGIHFSDENTEPLTVTNLNASASADHDPVYKNSLFTLSLHKKDNTVGGKFSLNGEVCLNRLTSPEETNKSEPFIPIQLKIPFLGTYARNAPSLIPAQVSITDASVKSEKDHLRCSAVWTPQSAIAGSLDIARLGLASRFAFGRILPNGLASSLDNISGSLDFTLTSNSLVIPQLSAVVAEVTLQGKGGIADFSQPVIYIDVAGKSINLNRIMPELGGKKVAAPQYTVPVIKFGNKKNIKNSLSYDIRIHADEALFWRFKAEEMALRIAPGNTTTRLTAEAKRFYGGSFGQQIEFCAPMQLKTTVSDILAEKFIKVFEKNSSIKGRLSGTFAGHAPRGGIRETVAGIDGVLEAHLKSGQLTDSSNPFESLNIRFVGTGNGNSVSPAWSGKWRTRLVREKTDLTVTSDGTTVLSPSYFLPIYAEKLPSHASGTYGGIPLECTGNISFSVADRTFASAQTKGIVFGLNAEADIDGALTDQGLFWRANGSASTENFRSVLAYNGISVPSEIPAHMLAAASAEGTVTMKNNTITATVTRGHIDNTSLSGHCIQSKGAPLTFDLFLGSIDLNRYLPSAKKKYPHTLRPFATDLMYSLRTDGKIHIEKLNIADISMLGITIPFALEDGALIMSPCSAQCFGGTQRAALRARAVDPANAKNKNNGIDIRVEYSLKQADILDAAKIFSPDTLITGKADVGAYLEGRLKSLSNILHTLSGKWQIKTGRGALIKLDPKTRKIIQSYDISEISGSGLLQKNLMTCNNLLILGDKLAVRGNGNIDLINKTVDYRINASIPGVPTIPITYRGPFSAPDREIGLMSVLLGVLGNISKELFLFIDDILLSPIRSFM